MVGLRLIPPIGSPVVISQDVSVVGREPGCEVYVNDGSFSRRHARIERRGAAWVLLDLGSTNLTRVNGDPIRERELRHGDVVQFARARCRFEDAPADPVAGGV